MRVNRIEQNLYRPQIRNTQRVSIGHLADQLRPDTNRCRSLLSQDLWILNFGRRTTDEKIHNKIFLISTHFYDTNFGRN